MTRARSNPALRRRTHFSGHALLCAALLTLTGCPATPNASPGDASQLADTTATPRGQTLVNNPGRTDAAPPPQDAPAAVQVLIQLEVHELLVPYGTVSQNETFWKRINEQVLSVEVADRLWRNGIRVGEAPASEWPYFKQIIDQNPAMAKKQVHIAREAKSVDIPIRPEEPFQNLFHLGDEGLTGRSYERCTTHLALSFQPTPRQLGAVRVAVTPCVRSVRGHLQFAGDLESRTIEHVTPEYTYDLSLRADVPLDSFLVIAPSTEARLDTLIGARFFTVDGQVEKMERVLLLAPVPRPIEVRELPEGPIVLPKKKTK